MSKAEDYADESVELGIIIYELESEIDSLQDRLYKARVEANTATEFIHYLAEKSGVLHTTADMLLEGYRFEVLRDLLSKTNR